MPNFVFIILKCVDLLARFYYFCTVLSHESSLDIFFKEEKFAPALVRWP